MIESFIPVEDITGHIFSGLSGMYVVQKGVTTPHHSTDCMLAQFNYPMLKVPGKCNATSKSVEKSKNLPRNV